MPSLSILAEPPVAVVDKVVLRRGTREVATEYLKYLYTPEAQEIIAKNFYRPIDPQVAAKYAQQFPKIEPGDDQGLRRLGQGAEACTSPTAACSIRSTRRNSQVFSRGAAKSTVGGKRGGLRALVSCSNA